MGSSAAGGSQRVGAEEASPRWLNSLGPTSKQRKLVGGESRGRTGRHRVGLGPVDFPSSSFLSEGLTMLWFSCSDFYALPLTALEKEKHPIFLEIAWVGFSSSESIAPPSRQEVESSVVHEDRIFCPNQESLEGKEDTSNYARTTGVTGNGKYGHPWERKCELGDPVYTPNPTPFLFIWTVISLLSVFLVSCK